MLFVSHSIQTLMRIPNQGSYWRGFGDFRIEICRRSFTTG